MYKLFAYVLNGVPVNELESLDNLEGNKPFKLSNTNIDNYVDITSIENWHKYGSEVLKDYQEIQKAIKLSFLKKITDGIFETAWSNCTNIEKDLVIQYYVNPDLGEGRQTQQTIIHLMMVHNMSQDEAVSYMIECWIKHWEKNRECCKTRWVDVVRCVLKYLNFKDASDLDSSLFQLKLAYLDSNLQGIGYGDSTPGIMNFINSDFDLVGNGLFEKNYILQIGTIQDFRDELEDVIIDKYFWDDIKTYLH
jgi:hypothetical protein